MVLALRTSTGLGGERVNFIKTDEIIFNENDLSKAIMLHTANPNEKYRVSIRNGYPCVCIGHNHYYVHRLLGEVYFGELHELLIHHKNGNKCDNSKGNLQPIRNSEHARLHHVGKDYRSKDGMIKSVHAMAFAKRRNDINQNDVINARGNGATYKELGEMFNCGQSVICRCLKGY